MEVNSLFEVADLLYVSRRPQQHHTVVDRKDLRSGHVCCLLLRKQTIDALIQWSWSRLVRCRGKLLQVVWLQLLAP